MPKRNFASVEEFRANLHKEGARLVDFEGKRIPCILVDPNSYDEILEGALSTGVGADTLLDIFYDGQDVFVDVQISLRRANDQKAFYEANYLFYANPMVEFFESLTESGLMAIAPSAADYSSKVFMIQLPKKEAAKRALDIIKSNAKTGLQSR